MSGIAKGIGKVVGSITGANDAAKAQTNASNQSNATALQIFNQQQQKLSPFVQSGQSYLQGLNGLLNNRAGTLNDYYNSAEYQGLANQARYQNLQAAEATGGLGSTAISNQLAAIAPQLGQAYLNDRYNQLLGGVNIGLGAAAGTNAAAGNYSSQVQSNLQNIGSAQAGKYLANGNTITQGLGFLAGLF